MPAAAPPATIQNLCQLIVQSRLMNADEIKAAYQRWGAETPASVREELEPFRRFLTANRHLTEYQSALLMRGHTDFHLDSYIILDRVGKGRMAGVYKATAGDGIVSAIKVLPTSKAKDTTTLGRFQREAKLVSQLSHPNIVRSSGFGESNGRHYIVLEHLEGETLQEVLERRKKLTIPEAARIMYQLLQGLQQVHEKGMVHRDLKPSNIMLIAPFGQPLNPENTTQAIAKILDIGLGRAIFDEEESSGEEQLTTDGMMLGTPDYMPPEQARNSHNVDIRADVYSLGCVFYHMLTGQPPFPDANVLAQVLRHASETPRPLTDFTPEVPGALQVVVSTMLAKDPNQRYQTPDQAAQALRSLIGNPPDSQGDSLATYTTWLEGQPPKSTMRVPVARPAPGDELTHEIPTGKLAPDKRRKETPTRPSKSQRPAPPVVIEEIDVELVPVLPPPPEPVIRPFTDLDRRDVIMLSTGGGGVLLAIIIGMILASLFKRKDPEKATPETSAVVTHVQAG